MYWQKRFDRENPDKKLEEKILTIRKDNENYGYRRLHKQLSNEGISVNKKKIQRLVQKLGLQVISFKRKNRKYNSYRGTTGKNSTNRINRRFKTNILHQKITTDTTEFKYYEKDTKGRIVIKKIYLDPFMDLYNLEILSYRLGPKPTAKNIMDALNEAIIKTSDCKYRRTFHSDQGWGYQMSAYKDALKKHKIFQSMSRKGNCLDNSPIENFFGILKQEIYYGKIYTSYNELEKRIKEYIKYYNEIRIKEKLGWLSPVNYRVLRKAS